MNVDPKSRREFLAEVGKGTLWAALGSGLAAELGITPALGEESPGGLHFGDMEPLVSLMQDTEAKDLQTALLREMRRGTSPRTLLAAGALANARTFGGEDYIGFHTMMALTPALEMSKSMPEAQSALPIFKVLYRNTARIREVGGRGAEVLREVESPAGRLPEPADAKLLRGAVLGRDVGRAEALLAAMVRQEGQSAFEALVECVRENVEVHRTVLPYRAWDLIQVVGQRHALTFLRQSLRYCLKAERERHASWEDHGRVVARLLEEHHLLDREPGARPMAETEVESLSRVIFEESAESAAGAVARALAEGFDPAHIGEAIALAANQFILRDHGRPPQWEAAGKPVGSVHGDSIGVHAADSIHAWRNLSRVTTGVNRRACLILAAWQVARDREGSGLRFLEWQPVPMSYQLRQVKGAEAPALLGQLEECVRGNLQSHAAAVVTRCAENGVPPDAVFRLLLKFAISEDGALHAEKYYQTVWDEFHRTRLAFRWRHLLGLARVTASEYGRPAAGQAEARELLGV